MKNFKVGIDKNISAETRELIAGALEKENIEVVDVPEKKSPSKLMHVLTIAESFAAMSENKIVIKPYEDEFLRLKRRFTPKTKKAPEKTEKDFEALRKAEEKRERKKHRRIKS